MKTLIIGCGYVGLPLALRAQAQGSEVTAWVHSPASAEALREHRFARVVIGSVADEAQWKLLPPSDRVVHCASSSRGGPSAYREVFLEGARLMNLFQAAARRVFVSSTSVYGQADGSVVTEESPAEPSTETGKILREAENVAVAGGAIVVRSAGIYGPGRAVLLEKLERGAAVMEGNGSRWMNQVHRDDLVTAIELLLENGRGGDIYNAADDAPVSQRDYYAWCCAFLGMPLPPSGPVNIQRKRGNTNKRVSSAKLQQLGWEIKYRTFREGIEAATQGDGHQK